MGLEPSARYLALGKGSRSKYRGLAAWRHACLWRDALAERVREAVSILYFTPYPSNAPPYSWSRSAADAPGVERFKGPRELKTHGKDGCWTTVQRLKEEQHAWLSDGSWAAEVRARILRVGCRESLTDVLKLEDKPLWKVR